MKGLLILVGLITCVVLLDKCYDRLPRPLQRLYDLWEAFAHALGAVMSKVILTILWIIGFGPYAIIYKLLRKRDSKKETYWIDVPKEVHTNMHQQF